MVRVIEAERVPEAHGGAADNGHGDDDAPSSERISERICGTVSRRMPMSLFLPPQTVLHCLVHSGRAERSARKRTMDSQARTESRRAKRGANWPCAVCCAISFSISRKAARSPGFCTSFSQMWLSTRVTFLPKKCAATVSANCTAWVSPAFFGRDDALLRGGGNCREACASLCEAEFQLRQLRLQFRGHIERQRGRLHAGGGGGIIGGFGFESYDGGIDRFPAGRDPTGAGADESDDTVHIEEVHKFL